MTLVETRKTLATRLLFPETRQSFSVQQEEIFKHFKPENEIGFASHLASLGASTETVETYLKDQVEAFLKEYVGQVPQHVFYYSPDSNQQLCIFDTEIPALEIFEKSARLAEEQSIYPQSRERAEAIGFEKIQKAFAKKQASEAVWLSPPSPEIDGFGDYSFAFVFQKDRSTGIIKVTAIRYQADPEESLSLLQRLQDAFAPATKSNENHQSLNSPQYLLARPVLIDPPDFNLVELVALSVPNAEEGIPQFDKILCKLSAAIDQYIEHVLRTNRLNYHAKLNEIKRLILGLYNTATEMVAQSKEPTFRIDYSAFSLQEIYLRARQQPISPIKGSCPSLTSSKSNPTLAKMENKAIIKNNIAYCPICDEKLDSSGFCETCGMRFEIEE